MAFLLIAARASSNFDPDKGSSRPSTVSQERRHQVAYVIRLQAHM